MPVTVMWNEDDGSVNCIALDIDEEETYSWPTVVTTHPVESEGPITDQVMLGNPKLVVSGYITNKPGPSNFLLYGALVEGLEQDDSASGAYTLTEITAPNKREYIFKNVELKIPGKPLRANATALVKAGFNALFPSVPTAQVRAVGAVKERKVSVQAWQLNVEGADPGKQRIKAAIDALVKLRTDRRRCSAMGDLYTLHDCVISDLQIPRKVEDGEGAPFSITFEQIKTVYAKETEAPTAAPGLQQRKQAGSKATEYSANYEDDQKAVLQSLLRTTGNLLTAGDTEG